MPRRFLPLFEAIVALCFATWASMTAAVLAAVPELKDVSEVVASTETVVMDDGKMRLICIIGAIGGGLLSALVFSPPKATGRNFAIKVGTSSLAGILFTPIVIHWLGWKANVDILLGISAIVAMIAIGAIRIAVPLWERAAGKRLAPPEDE